MRLGRAPVELREVELTYSAEAVVEAVRQSTVSAQIAGRIVDLPFDVGDRMQKGQVIARIDERAATQVLTASQAQVRSAEASLANARATYERSQQLFAQKFISQAALDKAQADYRTSESQLKAMLAGAGQAATERSFATIVAPYGGAVADRHAQLGVLEPVIKPRGIDDVPIVALTLFGAGEQGAFDLERVAHSIEGELKRVPGTREVTTLGGPGRAVRGSRASGCGPHERERRLRVGCA